ncbi:MAG: hypothetical protein WAW86_07185 [Gammaproteobacteria bacterium]
MLKKISLHAITVAAMMALFFCACYLLLNNQLSSSIYSIISSSHSSLAAHLLVLGLLPIYIAAVIFGSAVLALYIGPNLQQFLFRTMKCKND